MSNLRARLTRLEAKATAARPIIFVVPDGTRHKMIDEGRAITRSEALQYRETLTEERPYFVAVDPACLDL